MLGFLPQAILWTLAKYRVNSTAAKFIWITKWYAQITGWITTILSLFAFWNLADDGDLSWWIPDAYAKGSIGKGGGGSVFWQPTVFWQVIGITGFLIEAASWAMFYYSFKKSVSYGRYLAEELAKEVEEEADETTEGI